MNKKEISKLHITDKQKIFMQAGGQETEAINHEQAQLYFNLVKEEMQELEEAFNEKNYVEILDAIADINVVLSGLAISLQFDLKGAEDEVFASNMSKVDKKTGKVIKNAEGKILKPEGYFKPNLAPFVPKELGGEMNLNSND